MFKFWLIQVHRACHLNGTILRCLFVGKVIVMVSFGFHSVNHIHSAGMMLQLLQN